MHFDMLRAMNNASPNIPAIQFDAIGKKFGDFAALKNVSFDIQAGEFFALLGPNGAGKSTLIGCLAGLTTPTAGTAKIFGHNVQTDYRAARRLIGVVPQELAYDPFFTAREVLQLQSGYFGLRNNTAWIDELLRELGLSDKADVTMRGLSGGMKRRVLIAQALVHKPPVIVLDEPTAGVDVELRHLLWRFIKRLHREGHTVVLTTHYLDEAEELCDRVAILQKGQLKALDTKRELLQRHPDKSLAVKLKNNAQFSVDDWPEPLKKVVLREEDHWLIPVSANLSYADIMKALTLLPAEVIDIETRQADLEEVFLHITQSGGEESV